MADGLRSPFNAGNTRAKSSLYSQHNQSRSRLSHRTGLPAFSSSTPSPSPSPGVPNKHQGMFGQGGHGPMMNGGSGHRGFMQMGVAHNKFQHPSQQHHGQHSQHHAQNQNSHNVHGALGHQYTTSTGINATSAQNFEAAMQNGAVGDEIVVNDAMPPHYQRQLVLLSDARNNLNAAHRYCKREQPILSVKQATAPAQPDESQRDDSEPQDRNRPAAIREDPRQDWSGMDMSGQGLRCLSTQLFTAYTFLTKLFVDNNKLTVLPRSISSLRSLTHLYASNNGIREIPDTIGMLSRLEELLLFHNNINSLPTEVGLLYSLETLGIEGNPIDDETKEFIVQNGTPALVTHLRDHADLPAPPRPRERIVLDDSDAAETFTVLDWNILCDKYATPSLYKYTAARALEWEYRRDLIMEEIKSYDADFLCLQEIDLESFEDFFRRELAYYHYQGMFWQKSRARTMLEREARLVDGCAIFYKSQKYILLDKHFTDFANMAINRTDMKGEHDIFNRVMPRDNIAVTAFFENRVTGSRMMISNTHITWDPALNDVKLVQIAILMEQIAKKAEKWAQHPPKTNKAAFKHTEQDGSTESEAAQADVECAPSAEYASGSQIPLVVCGDLNSDKQSGVYELLSRGSVAGDHPDLTGRSYGSFTRDGMSHPFNLRSAYVGEPEDYIQFTNYTPNFVGQIEYIWHSTSLRRRQIVGDIDFEYLQKVPGFPNYHFPSDHLYLFAEFAVEPRKKREAVEADFGPQRERRG